MYKIQDDIFYYNDDKEITDDIIDICHKNKIKIFKFKNIKFDSSIDKLSQLNHLIEIKLRKNNFNQEINKLPIHIQKLTLNNNYNNSLDILHNYNELTTLVLGENFDLCIDKLPLSLNTLIFTCHSTSRYTYYDSSDFNKEINNLPANLYTLYFHSKSLFNQSIDNLPIELNTLNLGICFNQPIDNLPPNLHTLIFYIYSLFNQLINNLPTNLYLLKLPYKYNNIIKNLPNTLHTIYINENYKYINDLIKIYPHIKFNYY
jgi:hypothetical protein